MKPVAKIEVRACDACGTQDDVRTYRVTAPGGKAQELDLCREHAEPVDALLGKVRTSTSAGFTVITEEELEERKRSVARRSPGKG